MEMTSSFEYPVFFLKEPKSSFHYHAFVPSPYFQFGRAWCAKFCINCDGVGVVMEMHNIPPGESSSQVRALEQELTTPQLASSMIVLSS
jgi:hypothetical protein